jgi:hypothetical protein
MTFSYQYQDPTEFNNFLLKDGDAVFKIKDYDDKLMSKKGFDMCKFTMAVKDSNGKSCDMFLYVRHND